MTEKEKCAQMIDLKGQWKEVNRRIEYIESLEYDMYDSKQEDLGYWLLVRKELQEVAAILEVSLTLPPQGGIKE